MSNEELMERFYDGDERHPTSYIRIMWHISTVS